MQGSIRFILGLLLAWGAVGSLDSANNTQLIIAVLVAIVGLYSMYSGARALQQY